MSFTFRLFVSYGILFIGVQVIYFGMRFNGADSPRNPMWGFAQGLQSVLTYGTIGALGAVLLVKVVISLFFALIPDERSEKLKTVENSTPNNASEQFLEEENRFQQKGEESPETKQIRERTMKAQEMEQEAEELRQKQIIEKRRNRSAEEAAKSALEDFL